jgi:Trk-type K+ transport system membrane component
MLAPAILGFVVVILVRRFSAPDMGAVKTLQWVTAPVLFALSFAFGIAFPILFRTLFVHKNRHEKGISEDVLFKFERNTLYIALVAPYIALAGFFLEIPRFHLVGALLACFYAVYYFYPSRKRIQYERRIFRAK